ncbi:hypothetical protein L6J37_06555 [Photobacterium sp. WH77]|uniref:hypothetical protein n=1 Tax=unclassified Photobacterium TaxID=2628852 RepID=UPI001EDBEC01|nr:MULTISPECIES: hypothetical protein [unclassified Photobacterium]MCG2836524.1 hypothetical protein [Photobacterium sp. WH77]MCG2844349.1 hypothetical protein [Photobacterium sp. WH80]
MENVKNRVSKIFPYKNIVFWLSFFLFFILVSLSILIANNSESLPPLLEKFTKTYNAPLSLFNILLPLFISSYISVKTSQPSKLELETFKNKIIRDEFNDKERHFINTFGSISKNYSFSFVLQDDLPVIFTTIYEGDRLIEKGKFSIKKDLTSQLKHYFDCTERILEGYIDVCNEELSKNNSNINVIENYTLQLLSNLHNELKFLHHNLGVRFLSLNDASISMYQSAFFETLHLIDFIGDDFKELSDEIVNRESSSTENSQSDIISLFEAANSIAKKHMGTVGEVNYDSFYSSIHVRHFLKYSQGGALYALAREILEGIIENLKLKTAELQFIEEDDELPKVSFFLKERNVILSISFSKVDERNMEITAQSSTEKLSSLVSFIDDENRMFKFGDDVGETFISKCNSLIRSHLGESMID